MLHSEAPSALLPCPFPLRVTICSFTAACTAFFPEEISSYGDKNRKKGNNFLLIPRPGLETPLTNTVHPEAKPTCKRTSSQNQILHRECSSTGEKKKTTDVCAELRERKASPELQERKAQVKIGTRGTLAQRGELSTCVP